MRFSIQWLKRYLRTNACVGEIAEKLNSLGMEVESFQDPEILFASFMVCQVKSVADHPSADRLHVCEVETYDGKIHNVVCGAKNVRSGIKAVFALPGAKIPSTGAVIKKSKLRGVYSEGMLCSYDELGIDCKDCVDGIIELPCDVALTAELGVDVFNFGGGIIDVSVTPNRGDCLSVMGIARDLAASGIGEFFDDFCDISVDCKFPFSNSIYMERSEAIAQYMPRFAIRVIRGIKNVGKIEEIEQFLSVVGVNSVCPVVDIANFLTFDRCRPFHVYDLAKTSGDVVARMATMREKFTDIKGKDHILIPTTPVVADDNGVLCMLGIMGSNRAMCDENTTDILLESAYFDPAAVARVGNYVGITSDSRSRFERGIDYQSCVSGLEYLSDMILKHCGGQASEILYSENVKIPEIRVSLRECSLEKVTGAKISFDRSKNILKNLGLIESAAINHDTECCDSAIFKIPSWRHDLAIERDLIEEVLRVVGYDCVQEKPFDICVITDDQMWSRHGKLIGAKRNLCARGLDEIVTYSFISTKKAEVFKGDFDLINVSNPISSEMSVMRPSLLPNLLDNCVNSINYGKSDVAIFELGNVFEKKAGQILRVGGVRCGYAVQRNWLDAARFVDVFDAKGDFLWAISSFGLDINSLNVKQGAPGWYHPYRSGTFVSSSNNVLGTFGEIHPLIRKMFGIDHIIVGFELNVEELFALKLKESKIVNKIFQHVERDFSFIFKCDFHADKVINKIRHLDKLIASVDIFDNYTINTGSRAIGIHVLIQPEDRTLTDDELTLISTKIISTVDELGGELRKK